VARASGYLTAWNKDLGATVKAGEVLATIETPELDQEVAEANASFHEAAAAAVQARAELQEAEAELQVAEAQRVRVQADANLAVSQLARREALLKTRAISEEEYDTFQKQVEARNADVRAAESDVARRRSNLDTRAAVIAARDATAKSREANVERLKELQAFKHIVAPFDGVVTNRNAEIGMLVTSGKDVLFTIEDMSRVRVQVNVPQAYAAQTAPGTSATVHVPETAAKPTAGTITRIAEGVDPTTRTMLAEIELANPSRRFQPGSYAQVSLTTTADASSWTIPTNTVQMRVDGPHVAVVDDQHQIELRRVTLGRDLGRRVVVTDGIDGGERLVVNPGDGLAAGTSVKLAGSAKHDSIAMQNTADTAE
jgi:multidrug efflux pump subunit AcrA (membrane-fusion protein)